MANLTLDPEQVASERQVILEEIAMYDSEPWDALEMAVHERLFRRHPYGQPGARHPRGAAGDRTPRSCAPSTAASTGRTTPCWWWRGT